MPAKAHLRPSSVQGQLVHNFCYKEILVQKDFPKGPSPECFCVFLPEVSHYFLPSPTFPLLRSPLLIVLSPNPASPSPWERGSRGPGVKVLTVLLGFAFPLKWIIKSLPKFTGDHAGANHRSAKCPACRGAISNGITHKWCLPCIEVTWMEIKGKQNKLTAQQ